MNNLDSTLTKLDALGVKGYIVEVEKANFHVYFKNIFKNSKVIILNKSVINSWQLSTNEKQPITEQISERLGDAIAKIRWRDEFKINFYLQFEFDLFEI